MRLSKFLLRILKSSILRIVGVILFAFLLILIVSRWYIENQYQKGKYETEKDSLNILFDSINKIYWKDYNKSLQLSNKALDISGRIGDSNAYTNALFFKSAFYFYLGREDSTLILFNKVQEIAGRLHNDTITAKVKNGIANYYWKKDNYYQAMVYFTEALRITERLGDKNLNAKVLNGLGVINKSLGNYDASIEYLKRAKKICTELKQPHTVAITNLNIANCYMGKKDYSKALSFLQTALTSFLQLKDSTQINGTYLNLGNAYKNLKNPEEALKYYNQALNFAKRINNQDMLCLSLLNIGIIYLEASNLDQANEFLMKSLESASKIDSKSGEMNALSSLSEVEQKKGNILLSYSYYKRYIAVRDSIIDGDSRKKIAELQWQYDIQKKEYETVLVQKKYELKKRQNLSLFLFFALSVITLLMIGRNIKKSAKLKEIENKYLQDKIIIAEKINKLEKSKLLAEIEARNKELTSTSLLVVTKNEFLSDISGMVDKLFRAKSIGNETYNSLNKLIKENQNIEKDWLQFKELFENVHVDFFTKLKSTCPELTENDLRLCAYIKINLRAKEIARILNLNADSIKVFKYRLRKKLNLPSEISIEDYFRNI